jgi:lysophospholipase L1-like esterase
MVYRSIFRSAWTLPVLASAALSAALVVSAATPALAAARGPHAVGDSSSSPEYYLALGDSLSVGVQPAPQTGTSEPTDQGYADDLAAHYNSAFAGGLTLVKMGCSGETAASMLTGTGSSCTYSGGSQLAAALAFISAHRSNIALITIDIGANDVDNCAAGGTISLSCIASGVAAIQSDLPKILSAIHSAAGNGPVIAGMDLYDPFLQDYLTGPAGQQVAWESAGLAVALNSMLAINYRLYGAQLADVAGTFSTTDFLGTTQLAGTGTVPLNVARICQWTWMCAASPLGPNIHANAAGYQQIATAFETAIGNLSAASP